MVSRYEVSMKRMRVVFILTVFVLGMMSSISTASANFSVYVSFNDAYYADLDSDTLQDDIRLDMTIEIYNYQYSTDVELYVGITLPSGTQYWFLVTFTVYKSTYGYSTGMLFNAYDTATESGWYDASAVGFANGESYSIMETITFDPPGGSGPGNPQAEAIFY